MHSFRSSLLATALLLAATPPAQAQPTSAILVNDTGRTWRIRPAILFGQRTAVALAQSRPPGPVQTIQTTFNEPEPPTIDLPPHSELEISHEQAPGQRFTGWFNLLPAEPGPEGGAARSGLRFYYQSRPGLLFRWRQQTSLGSAVDQDPDGLPAYRIRQVGQVRMVLEEAASVEGASFMEEFMAFTEPF